MSASSDRGSAERAIAARAIADMLQAIGLARRWIADTPLADYSEDPRLRFAVERALEIVSEASRRIPARLKESEPGVPWADVASIGNVLRHEYHNVYDDMIWMTVQSDLGPLEVALRRLAAGLTDDPAP